MVVFALRLCRSQAQISFTVRTKIRDFEDVRLLADIEFLVEETDNTGFDSHIRVSSLLCQAGKMRSQLRRVESTKLTSTASFATPSTVIVRSCPR